MISLCGSETACVLVYDRIRRSPQGARPILETLRLQGALGADLAPA
jgi:hypothetical protein